MKRFIKKICEFKIIDGKNLYFKTILIIFLKNYKKMGGILGKHRHIIVKFFTSTPILI